MQQKVTRRGFLATAALAAAAMPGCAGKGGPAPGGPPQEGKLLEDTFFYYDDPKTGARIYNLTADEHRNKVVYQTHPQWSNSMEFLVFESDRSGPGLRPHAVSMLTTIVRPLTSGPCDAFAVSHDGVSLFYVSEGTLYRTSIAASYSGIGKAREIGKLPENTAGLSGGLSVDADGTVVYAGLKHASGGQWGIVGIEVASGNGQGVCAVDFPIGHVQANPWAPGLLMFCHETGGDAPQRMWSVRRDGSGLQPAYVEHYDEWVTHECWWGPDRTIFTIWPYDEAHKAQPHGVAVAALGSGTAEILAAYPAWHTQGSPNGLWALGDDHDRNLWLIHPETKERRLLTQGHNGAGFQTHPHASFTPDSRGIVFNSSRNGSEQVFLVELPAWDKLPA